MDALEKLSLRVTDPAKLLDALNAHILRLEGHIAGLDQRAENSHRKLKESDEAFERRLDEQTTQLRDVHASLEELKANFERSSDGALRVGLKLEKADGQRRRMQTAAELLALVQTFEDAAPSGLDVGACLEERELRELLPRAWAELSWGEVSGALKSLKTVLHNINSEDAKVAPKHVSRLAALVEAFLLRKFDASIMALIAHANDETYENDTLDVCTWLHVFNAGASVQEYYARAVVNKRIVALGAGVVQVVGESDPTKDALDVFDDDDDDDSSVGDDLPAASLSAEERVRREVKQQLKRSMSHLARFPRNITQTISAIPKLIPIQTSSKPGAGLADSFSELFGMISTICGEQFPIIARAFPRETVCKVTKTLVQLIFNDPAFGIKIRVDGTLRPKPPQPPLSLTDYLDCLLSVKEKLFALQIILREHSSADQYAKYLDISEEDMLAGDDSHGSHTPDAISEEITEYLRDQVTRLLEDYQKDYFDRELNYLRLRLVDAIGKATKETACTHKIAGLAGIVHPPQLKCEKFKSIEKLSESVATVKFVNASFLMVGDALSRMLVIGDSDPRLHAKVQQLYNFLLEFASTGLLVPVLQACTAVLLQRAAARPSVSLLPPMELLGLLGVVFATIGKLKDSFTAEFMVTLSAVPNAVSVCRENRKRAVRLIEGAVRDALHAWTLAVVAHLEKQLSSLQSKYDFCPKNDVSSIAVGRQLLAPTGPSIACASVCKSVLQVFTALKDYSAQLERLNLQELFWKPLGQQFAGMLISHIKKLVVNREGSAQLLRDIAEYSKTISTRSDLADLVDMLSCLKEIAGVFVVGPDSVARLVMEDLRHLDTAVVLSLVKSRADYSPGGGMSRVGAGSWTKSLEDANSIFKGDILLPWEGRKSLTILAFSESAKVGQGSQSLGPLSLKKVSLLPAKGLGSRNGVPRPSSLPRSF